MVLIVAASAWPISVMSRPSLTSCSYHPSTSVSLVLEEIAAATSLISIATRFGEEIVAAYENKHKLFPRALGSATFESKQPHEGRLFDDGKL